MQKQVDEMQQDIKDIKNFLLGDEYNDNGVVKRIKDIEKYQEKDKKQKYMIAGGAFVVGMVAKFWDKIIHTI